MEKRALILLAGVFLVVLLNIALASAALNLRVTGTINDYSSDLWLKTNSASDAGLDAYDMQAPSSPSDYSSLYSDLITGESVAIDSWADNPRTLSLVYGVPDEESGTVTFSWQTLTGYTATFGETGAGNDVAMESTSVYTTTTDDSDIYITVVVRDVAEPAPGPAGAGGGGAAEIVVEGIEVSPTALDVPIVVNTVKTRKLTVYNKGETSVEVYVAVNEELENIALIKDEDSSFKLAPKESRTFDVRFAAPGDPGIYTGKIFVSGQEVLVTLNVNTKELLFDVGVVIPEEFKILDPGERLQAQVTLIPMGEDPRVDTTLEYVIKDFEGRTFLPKSETMLVDSQKTFMREFNTEDLPPGKYVLGLEVTYLDSVATSSDHFEVKGREEPAFALMDYRFVLLLLLMGILILLILIILMIRRHKKLRKYVKLRKRK